MDVTSVSLLLAQCLPCHYCTQIRTHTSTLVSTQARTADRGVYWPGAKAGVKRSTVHFLGALALAIQLIIYSLCPRCCNRLGREAVNHLNVALTFTQPAEQEVLNTCVNEALLWMWLLTWPGVEQFRIQVKRNRIQAATLYRGLISYSVDRTVPTMARENRGAIKCGFQISNDICYMFWTNINFTIRIWCSI